MNVRANPLVAEAFGTACLVLTGCASATIGGYGATPLGILAVALVFGFTLTFLIYAIGPISGCHINPAITLGLWVANRFPGKKVAGYVLAQLLGGIVGAGILALILSGQSVGYDIAKVGLGQTGWGSGVPGGYGMAAAFATEFLATLVFMVVIITVTDDPENRRFAGLAIGLCLAAMIACFANVSGASLNPARSVGPAIFVGGTALSQLWLFLLAPVLGAAIGGLALRRQPLVGQSI